MARSDTITLLPLDVYAKQMAIQQCAFNQVFNPLVAYPQPCNSVWLQSAWVGTSSRLVGRDEIATAVNMAEEMIAQAMGFWPAPTWTTGEQQPWPIPRRGRQITYPPFGLNWGYIIGAGVEASTVILTDEPITYTDRDADGILDTATITITAAEMAAAGASWFEIAVYYPSVYLDWSPWPRDESWRIKPLAIALDPVTGDVELTGSRCQFVRPDLWDTDNAVDQSDAPSFITAVDIYRRYHDTTTQAQLVWQSLDDCLDPPCGETCQTACVQVEDPRNSIVKVIPATYSAGAWAYNVFSQCCGLPDFTRTWYLSGFYKRLAGWMEADLLAQYNPAMAQAIVRLANTYLPEAPCDCQQTQARWKRDREEMSIDNLDTALAMSAFGTTMRGAVFAWSVIKRLNPLAGAGAI